MRAQELGVGPPLGARSAARFVSYENVCESMLKPPAAILESLGAVLGAVLGLLGGPWGGSEHLGGTWGASWKSWRAPGGARGLYFTSIFVSPCCCLQSNKRMNKSGGAILCRNLQ